MVSKTFRGLWVLILVSTLVCAMGIGREAVPDRRSGETLSGVKRLEVCLVAPEIGAKLAGNPAPAKPKVVSAPLDVVLRAQAWETVFSVVRVCPPKTDDTVSLHLAGTMVLRV